MLSSVQLLQRPVPLSLRIPSHTANVYDRLVFMLAFLLVRLSVVASVCDLVKCEDLSSLFLPRASTASNGFFSRQFEQSLSYLVAQASCAAPIYEANSSPCVSSHRLAYDHRMDLCWASVQYSLPFRPYSPTHVSRCPKYAFLADVNEFECGHQRYGLTQKALDVFSERLLRAIKVGYKLSLSMVSRTADNTWYTATFSFSWMSQIKLLRRKIVW